MNSLNDPYTFAIAARSAVPLISVTRIERFSSTPLGRSSRPQRVFVTNAGEVPVRGLYTRLPGKSAKDFRVPAFTSRLLLPGESADLLVTFHPRAAGVRKALFQIHSDASFHQVAFSGRAVSTGRAVYSLRFPNR